MVKDYKITTTVNKELYFFVRGKLLIAGKSFSDWLEERMSETTKIKEAIKSKESVLNENKGGLTKSRGELNAEDYI